MPESKMLAEIRQQPHAIAATLRESRRLAERLKERRSPRLVTLVARGTSDNAAQFGRYLIELTTGIPVSLAAPSVITLYKAELDFTDALVVGISQSGESTDINVYLDEARRRGALTIAITNEAESAIVQIAHDSLLVHAGKEQSVAATKTYTSQMMALYLLAYSLGARMDWNSLEALPAIASQCLDLEPTVASLAQKYVSMNRGACIGRGLQYANAQEFGLKLAETCYVVAERFSAADFLHGPAALLEPGFPIFVFAPRGVTEPLTNQLLEKAVTAQSEILIFTEPEHSCVGKYPAVMLPPSVNGVYADLYSPIPYIIPAQLFAAHLSTHKGLDADKPRTLSKITRTI